VPHSLALYLTMCVALPVMSLHSVTDQKINHWVSALIDASADTQIQRSKSQSTWSRRRRWAPAPASQTRYVKFMSRIQGGSPRGSDGNRWFASSGAGKVTAKYAFKQAWRCDHSGDYWCSRWCDGLNTDQIRTLTAVIQATFSPKAQWITNDECSESSLLDQASLLSTVETSTFRQDGCIDPSVDEPDAWACECLDHAVDVCGGTNEECFTNLMCDSNGEANICESWKEANCNLDGAAIDLQQRAGVSSESAQANAPDSDVDPSLTGSLQQPSGPGALIAAAERRTQVITRSASTDSLDDTVQGKCSQ